MPKLAARVEALRDKALDAGEEPAVAAFVKQTTEFFGKADVAEASVGHEGIDKWAGRLYIDEGQCAVAPTRWMRISSSRRSDRLIVTVSCLLRHV